MTTVISNSIRSQNLYTFTLLKPHPILMNTVLVSTTRKGPVKLFTTQTEPALQMTLLFGRELGLSTADYNFFYNMDNRDTGAAVVTNGTVTLTFDSNLDPIFTYNWVVGDTATSGLFEGQFRVERKSDNFPLLEDTFFLWIYPAI